MPNHHTEPAALDRTFHALADPTRRAVLEKLGRGPSSVSELALPFEMSLPSFTQHLRMLEGCGLVRSHKKGRVRTYRLVPQRLEEVDDWLQGQRRVWQKRLDQLDAYLIDMKDDEND